jgi:AraC-like DNA-binding protein
MAATREIKPPFSLPAWMGDIVVPDNGGHATDKAGAYKILPKPWAVLGFQYRGRLSVVRDSGDELLSRGGVTGIQKEFRLFRPDLGARTIIVNLKPHAAFRLLGCPMDQIANAHVPLDAVLKGSTIRELERRIVDAPSIEGAARIIGNFVLRMCEHSRHAIHPAVAAAVERAVAGGGDLPIDEMAAHGGVSRRQLERLFLLQVGTSPKQFASIARFHWTVKRLAHYPRSIDLAYDAGYADQAHFIRSFARQAGVTPGRYGRDRKNS